MYKVKRKQKFVEQFQVENPDGETLTLDVEIALDKQFNDFQKNFRSMEVANIEIQKGSFDYKKLGYAVIGLMNVIFGEKNTEKLIAFYGANYIELIQDVMPFIVNVIKPQFEKEMKQRRKENKMKLRELA